MKKRFNTEVSREIRQWINLAITATSLVFSFDVWCNEAKLTNNFTKKVNKIFNKNKDTQENKESE